MTPDQIVVVSGLAVCGVVLLVAWRTGYLLCHWIPAWTRREPVPLSPEVVAHDLVAHAQQRGRARSLGWCVTHHDGTYTVEHETRPPSYHRHAYQAEARILREWP